MRRMDPHQISDEFNAKKGEFADACDRNGLAQAVEAFSVAIHDLKEAGMDISMEIFADASEMAFSMFQTTSLRTPISGILHIGPIHRLFAFATQENDQPILKLALSDFDIRFNGADGKIKDNTMDTVVRATIFDLKRDEDALVKFEKEMIRFCARNAVVSDHDVAEAFGDAPNLRKPSLKVSPRSS